MSDMEIKINNNVLPELKINNSPNFEIKVDGITLCRTANLLNDKKEIDESAHSFYKTAITDLREKLKKDNRYIANMEWTEDQVSGDLCLYITTNPLPLERHKNNE
jgi:hypothetical protein